MAARARLLIAAVALGALMVLSGPAAHAQTCLYPFTNCAANTTITAAGTGVQGTVLSNSPDPAASTDGGALPFTGSDVFRLLAVAAILLAVGTAVYRANRRRRTPL